MVRLGIGELVSLSRSRRNKDPIWYPGQVPTHYYSSKGYDARLNRARIANSTAKSQCGRGAEEEPTLKHQPARGEEDTTSQHDDEPSSREADEESSCDEPSTNGANDDASPRVMTELRMRLGVLAERDAVMWGVKEMKLALMAGDVDAEELTGATRKELRDRTQALAVAARHQWAKQAAAEAEVAVEAANARARPNFSQRFRALSRAVDPSLQASGTDRSDTTVCDDESSSDMSVESSIGAPPSAQTTAEARASTDDVSSRADRAAQPAYADAFSPTRRYRQKPSQQRRVADLPVRQIL